jgi:hypothetical protein
VCAEENKSAEPVVVTVGKRRTDPSSDPDEDRGRIIRRCAIRDDDLIPQTQTDESDQG